VDPVFWPAPRGLPVPELLACLSASVGTAVRADLEDGGGEASPRARAPFPSRDDSGARRSLEENNGTTVRVTAPNGTGSSSKIPQNARIHATPVRRPKNKVRDARSVREMTLPPLPPVELPFVRKEPPPAPAPDASAMERILGPAPALPVALPTLTGTPASVPRAGDR
jgi:hypothetical protein